MLAKQKNLKTKITIQYLAIVLSLVSAITAPLVDFQLILHPTLKWIIYTILVVSVSINAIPLLINLIPGRVKQRQVEDAIKRGLDTICSIFSHECPAEYRAAIFMLANKKSNKISINYCSTNMLADKNALSIEFEKFQGCTGTAWALNQPVVSDKSVLEKNGSPQWGLDSQQKKITRELKAVLSIPIRHPKSDKLIAILGFDSRNDVAKFFLRHSTRELATSYARIFGPLLIALGNPNSLN